MVGRNMSKQKKKALRKDFFMEISKSRARFISIFFIVALGVAFFSGIQSASPDMRLSGDAYYDASALMDLKVMGTLGITEEDIEALQAVKGVKYVEGAYCADIICDLDTKQKVLHVESMNEKVNQLSPQKGRLPEKEGECFLDSMFAAECGYDLGDTIEVSPDGDSDLLKVKKYEIVGTGTCPLYISFNRGNTTLGSGEIDGFMYVTERNFDSEVYTQAYLLVKEADVLTSYTDSYTDLVDQVQERVEDIQDVRCQIRYEDIVAEAQEKLSDAEKELADGKKEAQEKLSDAEKELSDAEKELSDGWKEYEDGKQQLEDAKKELEDGKEQLSDAKKELEDGRAQLAQGRTKLDAGYSEAAAARSQLDSGWSQLNTAKAQLAQGQKQLEEGKAELSAKSQELEEGKAQLAQGWQQLEAGKAELASQEAVINQSLTEIAAGEAQIEEKRGELAAGRALYEENAALVAGQESQLGGYYQQLVQLQAQQEQQAAAAAALQAAYDQAVAAGTATAEELAALQQNVAEANAQLAAISAQVSVIQAAVREAETALAAAKEQLAGALAQLEAGETQLNAQAAQLAQGRQEAEAGLAVVKEYQNTLAKQEQVLLASQAELSEGEEKLNSGREEMAAQEQKLAAGWNEIAANEQTLKAGEASYGAGQQELTNGESELAASQQTIAAGEAEIQENEQKLLDAEKEIQENEEKLADAHKELLDGDKELADGRKEYEDAKKEAEEEIAEGEEKLADAKKELSELKEPVWYVSDRNDLPEYADYGDNADRIRNIGQVFPVIFFLVAALISLTTMTRMVEEQRTQIGTMKALGYGKYDIASKYLSYAFLATVGGSVLGVLIGEKILPYIIIHAYGIMYHNMSTHLVIDYEFKFAMIASVAAVVCTIGATVSACYRELAETPAGLMRPPAPKEGKRVFLERIPFIWKRLSFSWKSTIRNLFRYKKRFFMTIFGISGSMALMLVGFGIRDSIMDIAIRQYEEIQHYEAMIIDDEDASEEEKKKLQDYLENQEKIAHCSKVMLTNMTTPYNRANLSVYLYVPENLEDFSKDVTLQDRVSKEQYTLSDEGAVICEKTASLLGLKRGDTMILEEDNKEYPVTVTDICENYMGHYVYMTPNVYESVFGEVPEYNDTMVTMKPEYQGELEAVGEEILAYEAALSISYMSSIKGQLDRMLSTLSMVIVVLIVSAGMLAFVVLYNLNNINITERQRELATLKVLGFFDGEVSQYVFRENVLLTILGVLFGVVFGIVLHRFVIVTVEVDAVMFGRNIAFPSFLYSGAITIAFSIFVNMVMHFKLKKIDMVESLKSVE